MILIILRFSYFNNAGPIGLRITLLSTPLSKCHYVTHVRVHAVYMYGTYVSISIILSRGFILQTVHRVRVRGVAVGFPYYGTRGIISQMM